MTLEQLEDKAEELECDLADLFCMPNMDPHQSHVDKITEDLYCLRVEIAQKRARRAEVMQELCNET